MQRRHAQHACPHERGERTGKRAGKEPTQPERGDQRDDCEQRKETVHRDEVTVAQQVGREPTGRRRVRREQPAAMRVEQPEELTAHVGTEAVRRVRVARAVAVHVVSTVVRHPADGCAFDRHRARDREGDPERSVRREAAVREETMWNPTVTPNAVTT